MARLNIIEPLVYEALVNNKASRGDNFILYLEVLKKYINLDMSIKSVFANHKDLGIPALETITRCRRKLQEKNPELRDEKAVEIRKAEEEEFKKYSREWI